jgi:hypothetical protein
MHRRYLMLRHVLIGLFALLLLPSFAHAAECTSSIKGQSVRLTYSSLDYFKEDTTLRDLAVSRKRGVCPGYVVLQHMAPALTDKQRETFCLDFDAKARTYRGISLGQRDAYGECSAPGKVCEFVNAKKDAALTITGLAAGASGGATAAATAAGVTAVTHSSGAIILTGSAGYIGGTLGTIGAGAVAVLTAPAVLAGAAVSLVAVGGAVYVCA